MYIYPLSTLPFYKVPNIGFRVNLFLTQIPSYNTNKDFKVQTNKNKA